MVRKTKIIATISNRSCEPEFIEGLFNAGMNVVRLNTAHMTHDDALQVINNTRKVSDKIAILIDTKGPEIRTCASDVPMTVRHGDAIRIKGDHKSKSIDDVLCVSYDNFVRDIPMGSSIMIDDGCIALAVMEKDEEFLYCYVENDGIIGEKKSINIPSVHVKLPALSEKDKAFIEFSTKNHVDFIAHSFVRNKEDVLAVQEILDKEKSKIKIIAKIENSDGVDNLNEILNHAYGIMVARGDLAVEIPTERIPLIQKQIVKTCIRKRSPVIIATQMLHTMIESPRPTRAEVSDVANACIDHTDALMLSGETASGKYPEEAVRTMASIAKEVETRTSSFVDVPYAAENKVTAYLAKAGVKASLRLNTKAILADSMTGRSIREIAAYRGDNPIFAQVYDEQVMRELALSYGVYANFIKRDECSLFPFARVVSTLLKEKRFFSDDLVTVLAGNFGANHGVSYVEIAKAGDMMQLS
jgi:pyruvate kinase